MDKKYELVYDDYKMFEGRKLFRIRALKDFQTVNGLMVKAGDFGGYIQNEKNLSQEGNCWVAGDAKVIDDACVFDDAKVYDKACVFDDARVYGNAEIFNNACVCGNAEISDNACVFDYAKVFGDARVYGDACVCGNAEVSDNAWVFDNAKVFGDACEYGNACVYGNADVYGNACVYSNAKVGNNADICNSADYICIKGLGTFCRTTTFYKCKDNHIGVTFGSFKGTLDEFVSKVESTHKNNKFGKEYLAAIEMVKIHFDLV